MSVSTSTLALNTPSLFVQKFGRLPTFDEAREIGMQFASLAAILNVSAFNIALNKGPAPEIPNDWKAAQQAFAADLEDTLTAETVATHFQQREQGTLVERLAQKVEGNAVLEILKTPPINKP